MRVGNVTVGRNDTAGPANASTLMPKCGSSEKIIANYWIGNYRNASVYGMALRIVTPACHGATIAKPIARARASPR